MRYRYVILAFFIICFVQGSLLNLFSIFGVTPNLSLCLITLLPLLYEEEDFFNIVSSVTVGMVWDILYGHQIGVTAMSYLLICIIIIQFRRFLNKESMAVAIMIMLIITMLMAFLNLVIYSIFGIEINVLYVLKKLPLMMLLNSVAMALMYIKLSKRVIRFRNDRYC